MMAGKRYAEAFARCRQEGRAAFVPFVVLGVPDLPTSLAWAENLVAAGADALELGLPFSDPVADGPVIQQACRMALEAGVRKADVLAGIGELRKTFPQLPLGILAYANLMMVPSLQSNYGRLAESGVDSVLLADVPVHAGQRFADCAASLGMSQVYIACASSTESRLQRMARECSAYVYVVSRQGVTGTQTQAGCPDHILPTLKAERDVPAVLGFGIDGYRAARAAYCAGFDGVVVGSLLVKEQMRGLPGWEKAAASVSEIIQGLSSDTGEGAR
jgi:tryptophan synthase alpha chain